MNEQPNNSDLHDVASDLHLTRAYETAPQPFPRPEDAKKIPSRPKRFRGLSTKLLLLTITFVMLSEVFVFLPSVGKFRNDWLTDRLTRARTVLLMRETPEPGSVFDPEMVARTQAMTEAALKTFNVVALAQRREGQRFNVVPQFVTPEEITSRFDVMDGSPIPSIIEAVKTLLRSEPGKVLVTGSPPGSDELFEVIVREAPLQQAMRTYTRNVMILSLIISLLTAVMVYVALTFLFVRPIQRMAENMVKFSREPELDTNIISPSGRSDEIGTAEEKLAAMQHDLQGTLSSQRRLANLGLAVSKINHDLRNILASVQLFSDRLTTLPDPEAQRLAPKLISGIDRAIGYCQATLVYGSAKEQIPDRKLVRMHALVAEMGALLDLEDHKTIEWRNEVPKDLEIQADPEQIFRAFMNLTRNSVKVLEQMEGEAVVRRISVFTEVNEDKSDVAIFVSDTGPGVPARAREHLFEAFRGSYSKGGTGLGLAIAHEIVTAHGGTLKLLENDNPGATFEIRMPL